MEFKKEAEFEAAMIDELIGSDFDMQGLSELQKLLGGGRDE